MPQDNPVLDPAGHISQPWFAWLDSVRAALLEVLGGVRSGRGSPAGVVSAPVGTIYRRTDGGASTTIYFKEAGTGSSGWRAV